MAKTIRVAAAVCRDGNRILAAMRGYGPFKGLWEFPGGKIEEGETPEEALQREMKEELNALIRADSFLMQVEYDYPDFHLSMSLYNCTLLNDHMTVREHLKLKWLTPGELDSLVWLPADRVIVDALKKQTGNSL